jgi:hypothetical protein
VVSEVIASVGREWPVVLSVDPVVRALAAAGELDLLAEVLDSLRNARGGIVARLALSVDVGEAHLDIAAGRFDPGAEKLARAVARNEELGFHYDAACLKLDLADARDRAGDSGEGERKEAHRLLDDLRCVNPF